MKKQERICSVVCMLLLFMMTSFVLVLYDNVKENAGKQTNYLQGDLDEKVRLFTIAKAKEVDPDYQVVTYGEDVPESIQTEVNEKLDEIMQVSIYYLGSDPNFAYEIKNLKNQKVISNHTELLDQKADKNASYLYSNMKYDEEGKLTSEGNQYALHYDEFNIKRLLDDYMQFEYLYTGIDEADSYEINYISVKTDQIKINIPQNLEVTYVIPEKMTTSGYLYSHFYSWETYNGFCAMALMLGSGILALFMLFYPIRIIENVQPFVMEKKWKSGMQILLLGTGITFGFMGVIAVTGNTLNGIISNLLEQYEIGYADVIILVVNFIVWFLTFYVIAVALFQIKYIFAHGIGRYFKEDTLIGSFFRYLKRKINAFGDIDLSNDVHRNLVKLVLIHSLIIMVIATTWAFGYILVIIYASVLFFWLLKKLDKVQHDYSRVSDAMRELGEGNFEVEIKEDVGMFNGMKDEFSHIRTAFEKAVKEKTKSQNMKTELISNVSHDLKTPLTCIKNYIVLLQDDSLDEETRHEYLTNLNQYANRLTTLIEDLFDVSKVNSGNMKLELMEINLVALLEQAQAECSDMLEEKELSVISDYPQTEISMVLDGGKTYRIFENLFTNIGKYAMPHSRVYVDVSEISDQVQIAFKNISSAQMNFTADEIVDRFVRGDKSRHENGSGLGLAIVKSFTEVQGGTFKIDIDGDLFKAILSFPITQQQKDQESLS